MNEIPEKELSSVRLAHDYCQCCYDYFQQKPVERLISHQHEDMRFFFHGMSIPFEGKGSFEFFMADKCIKCFEANYQQPEVAKFLESKLSSHLPKEESK
jgi:hypothetical protein